MTDMERTDFAALMHKVEELDFTLRLCIQDMGHGTTFIKHPLINTPYIPQMNAYNNALYHAKKKSLEEYEAAKNWDQAIWIHERPWRIEAFERYAGFMEPDAAAKMLLDVWQDCEHPYSHRRLWLKLFDAYRSSTVLMTTAAHLLIEDAPPITLYRGMGKAESNKHYGMLGLSWTLDRPIAEWFAKRYRALARGAFVAEAQVDVKGVLAYLPTRAEQEVIIDPFYITAIKLTEVPK